VILFEGRFKPFDRTWTNRGITVTSQGTYPAFERGEYFDGADHMTMTDFKLRFTFSIALWVRPDAIATATFFSKYVSGLGTLISFGMKADGKLNLSYFD
jgi:hypothetical protein